MILRSLLLVLCICGVCFPQDVKPEVQPQRYFKLDFSVKQFDGGRVVNARSYSMSVLAPSEGGAVAGELRAGEKIPFQAPSGPQQLEVGVNIDCRRIKEVGDKLGMNVSAEVSSIAASEEKTPLPLIRRTQMNINVLVPLKKPTLIFSSDEPSSKGSLQMELTATPMN